MTLTIAVSGQHGAGKTTVAKALADEFNLQYVSAGILFRQIAKERGMTLTEFSKIAEDNPEIDQEIDERTRREAEKGNVVIDAYIAGWVAQRYADLKFYLRAPVEVRALRIANRENRSVDDVIEETRLREESQKRRFQEFYGIDVTDMRLFDIILNTETWNAATTIEICITAVRALIKSQKEK